MNPLDSLVTFILGRMKASALAVWLKLIFEMVFSAVVSFLFVAGSMMVSGQTVSASIGSGMVIAAICTTVLFRGSPLTKGMRIVLPAKEAEQEIQTDIQTIERK